MNRILCSFFAFVFSISLLMAESVKLTGKVIGTVFSVDYSNNQKSTTVNTKDCAFDGDMNTYFASYDRSNTWVGLDLGTPHVITKVRWSPKGDATGAKRVRLGVFEGSNREDFMDAVPLFVIDRTGTIGKMSEENVKVSKGFRYVRYMGPNDARCNIAEVEFIGYEGEGSNDQYYTPTRLPLVNIHVKNAVEPKDKVNDLEADIMIISDEGKTFFEQAGTTRLRGNASMDFPKKPYRIKFEKKQNVLDAPAKAKKWTLISNYGDKTLMRNLLAFDISKRVGMEYTPYGRLVDVIFNGEYKGTYQLCDQVEVNKNRVNVEEMDEKCISGEDLTGGYLVEIDAYAEGEDNYFWSKRRNPVTIKYPDSDDILQVQTDYISNHFNKIESALFSSSYMSESDGYRKFLDLHSFLQHFIVGELSGNTDTYWSVNMYKRRGDDKFYVGPCWDFDIAFENDYRTYPINNKSDYVYRSGGSVAGNMKSFVDRIIVNDAKAKQELKNLWTELRSSGAISAEALTDFINSKKDEVYDSQKLNFYRWDILNTKVHMNPKAYGSFTAEVNNIIDYIKGRVAWMDKKLGYDLNGIDDVVVSEETFIYNLSGVIVGTNINGLTSGVYIVKTGNETKKIVIR